MGPLGRVLRGLRATTLSNPDASFLANLSGQSYSGKTITPEKSLALVPVYSAVSLLAGAIGSLPLVVYRRLDRGRERAENHRTWRLLHDQPNDEIAADEFWEIVGAHLNLWGNAFAWKERDSLGQVGALWPLAPKRVVVGRVDGKRVFRLDGRDTPYGEEDILHIRGLGLDGTVGLSPVQLARNALGAVAAIEEFTGSFWKNGAHPSGVLKHPNKLSDEAAARLAKSWKSKHGGPANAGAPAILEEGLDWQTVGMPLEDAQFLETQQFGDLRIAQLFRVPPYLLGAKSGDSLTYTNSEYQGIDFVRWSLRRWLVRIEKSLLRDPSIFLQGSRIYPEFLLDALLRASTLDRYSAHKLAIEAGFLTPNEARESENLNPLAGGDELKAPAAAPEPADDGGDVEPEPEPEE